MKTSLVILASFTLGGAAIAQDMQPPAGGAPMGMTAPADPMAQPAPAPMAPPITRGSPGAPGDMSSPMQAPMPAASMQDGSMSGGSMPMGMQAPASGSAAPMAHAANPNPPVCSRTVQDNCRNRGGK